MRYLILGLFIIAEMMMLPAIAQTDSSESRWNSKRIAVCLQVIERLHAQGLMSDNHYQRKRAMLEKRRKGTFKSTALATKDSSEVNFIQNGGFEQINRNSSPNRSRWLWWSGWSWGGDYENFWASGENAHSGKYAAGIRCKGKQGRIGIFTPSIPIIPKITDYKFSFWAKGKGDNMLFINFEGGCSGRLRQRIPSEWTELTVHGKAKAGAKDFHVYIYSIGGGTIYLDDAKLVPVGMTPED